MNIGERIKLLRTTNNKTLDELALYIGTTRQTVFKYENSIITNIPSDKIEKIAQYFNVSPSYLMGWENKTKFGIELEKILDKVSLELRLNRDLIDYIFLNLGPADKIELTYENILKETKKHISEEIDNFFNNSDFQRDDDFIEYLSEEDLYRFILFYKNNVRTEEGKKKIQDFINQTLNFVDTSSDNYIKFNIDTLTEIPISQIKFDDYFPLHYYSGLSAGSFEELLEAEPDSVVYVPITFQNKRKRLHAFKINGTSMDNVIADGSIVVVEDNGNGIKYKDGTIVVAFHDGQATVKRLYDQEDKIVLMPDSQDKSHLPITLIKENEQIYIVGKVIWHMNPDDISEVY